MAFPLDPLNSQVDRVRLITGDTIEDDLGYEDPIYEYVLSKYVGESTETSQELKSALEILRMLVAKYANYVTEKAGSLFVKESERYQQYKDLLEVLTRDPRNAIIRAGAGFTGGISIDAAVENRNNPDARLNPLRTQKKTRSRYNPYSFTDDGIWRPK